MTRPNAAFVGMGLVSHPIRLVMNRGLHGNVAKLISINEALELVSDLTTAIARALALENKDPKNRALPSDSSTHEDRPIAAE